MAKFRHPAISQLAHQLRMSPARLHLRQIEATEYLIDLLQANKYYPYEFVCHQITDYRPKGEHQPKPMAGKTLIEDLVLLVEEVSASNPLPIMQVGTPAWTTEELAKRLRVSSKTVCRWRRRGLTGRKLRYPDGSVRMAFTERSVRRFVAKHEQMVKRGAAFSQLTPSEKKLIIELARKELAQRRVRLHELSQIIAAKVDRAVETVRYTLRRYDETHPQEALFSRDQQPLVQPEMQAIYDAMRGGQSIEQLSREYGKPAATIQAMVREVRARRLLAQPIQFIANAEFSAAGAAATIDLPLPSAEQGETAKTQIRPPRELPPYLQELYRHPLLTAVQERHLFRLYNFLKFQAEQLRQGIDPLTATEAQLDAIEHLLARAETIKNDLLRANLRLVVSIARKHVGNSPSFFETVSDGNLALMRAVEKFDYARGFKFSTYASWAVMRNYARTIPEQAYHQAHLVTGMDELLAAAPATGEETSQESLIDTAKHLLAKGLALLTARERDIVVRHYGLDAQQQPMTLDQIGKTFGVTKERVRQIERKAIRKLQAGLCPAPAEATIED